MTKIMPRVAFGLLAMCGCMAAEALPDRPLREQTLRLADPAKRAGEDRTVRCVAYRGMTVREVRLGEDLGMQSVSVVAGRRTDRASCVGDLDRTDLQLVGLEGMSFGGAWGRFLLLVWPDEYSGTTQFAIYDASTRRRVHSDVMTYRGTGLSAVLLPGGNALRLTYDRGVLADCSVLTGGAACWASTVQANAMPPEFAATPPSTACAAAYAKRNLTGHGLEDPSVLGYRLVMTVAAHGPARTASHGPVDCWPAE